MQKQKVELLKVVLILFLVLFGFKFCIDFGIEKYHEFIATYQKNNPSVEVILSDYVKKDKVLVWNKKEYPIKGQLEFVEDIQELTIRKYRVGNTIFTINIPVFLYYMKHVDEGNIEKALNHSLEEVFVLP